MSFGIEMGTVTGMLEVFLAKFRILNLDTARRGSVEEGETMTLSVSWMARITNGKPSRDTFQGEMTAILAFGYFWRSPT